MSRFKRGYPRSIYIRDAVPAQSAATAALVVSGAGTTKNRRGVPVRAVVGNNLGCGDGIATQNYPVPPLPPATVGFTRGISMWH